MELYEKYKWLFKPTDSAKIAFENIVFQIILVGLGLTAIVVIFFTLKRIFLIITKGDGSFRAVRTIFFKLITIAIAGYIDYYIYNIIVQLYS